MSIRYYIKQSSLFDSRPDAYDIQAFRARLNVKRLISHPRACRAYGWSNQPQVLTFRLLGKATVDQVADTLATLPALQGRRPIVLPVDW